jgi:hypothetical protein
MHSVVKTLYRSPNGDSWLLAQDATGALFVTHKPNPSSGGQTTTETADEFLARSGDVPERSALQQYLDRTKITAAAENDHMDEVMRDCPL